MTKKRIYQIDLFRFLAALAVVLFHYGFRGFAQGNMTTLGFNEISHFFKYGYLGVDLFFIISGFVIILSIKHNSLLKFIASRITRLYPVYWLCVLLTFTTILLYGAPRYSVNFRQLIINLTMFQNYLFTPSIDGAYWSLLVEMKFYLFIVCTYLLLNKFKVVKLDHLIFGWLTFTILYPFFNHLDIMKIISKYLILRWSSYFISGIILYQIFSNKPTLKHIILLSICLITSLYNAIDRIETLEQTYNTNFSPYIIGTAIFIFYTLMFIVSTGGLKKINSPKLMKLGMMTYPLYLLHQNIGFIIFNHLGAHINKYILFSSTVVIMILCSYCISEFFEPKASALLKKITNRFVPST